MNSDMWCPSHVRNQFRRFAPHKHVLFCIVCSEASNVLWVMLTRRVHHSCARSWRVSRAVTLGEQRGPRCRAVCRCRGVCVGDPYNNSVVLMYMRACVRVCVRACVRAYVTGGTMSKLWRNTRGAAPPTPVLRLCLWYWKTAVPNKN